VDALAVFLVIAALYALRTADHTPHLAARASALSGLLMGLAILTKQTNALAAVGLLVYAAWSPRGRVVPYAIALIVVTVLPLVWLSAQAGDWARYFLLDLPRDHVFDEKHVGNFWTVDVFPRFTLPLVIGPFFLMNRAVRRDGRTFVFYALALLVMTGLAWGGWANRGASFNVYEPLFAILAVLFVLGLSEAVWLLDARSRELNVLRTFLLALTLAEFLILGYNPRIGVPLRSDGWAADRLTATIAAMPGTVFAPGFGEWTLRAGKGEQPSSSAVMEITGTFGTQSTPPGDAWLSQFSDALARRAYDQILWDPSYVDAAVIKSRIDQSGYVDAGPLFPAGDKYYEWKSGMLPDLELYVAKERLSPR
jgi:hypothetical protein